MYAFPAVFPFGVGEEASEYLGIKVALAIKIAVETTMCQASPGHDLLDRDALEAIAIE
jgi:hypothetical protein